MSGDFFNTKKTETTCENHARPKLLGLIIRYGRLLQELLGSSEV